LIKKYQPDGRQDAAFRMLRDSVILAINAHKLTNLEALAMLSNLVGVILASQDPTQLTTQEATDIIRSNIKEGNQSVINEGKPEKNRMN